MEYTNSYRAIENVFRYIDNATVETLRRDIYPEAASNTYIDIALSKLVRDPVAFWAELDTNNRFRFIRAVMDQGSS